MNGFLGDLLGTRSRYILPPCAHNTRNKLAFSCFYCPTYPTVSQHPLDWRLGGAPHPGYFSPPQYKLEYQVSPGSNTDEGQQVANPLLGNQLLVDLNFRFLVRKMRSMGKCRARVGGKRALIYVLMLLDRWLGRWEMGKGHLLRASQACVYSTLR